MSRFFGVSCSPGGLAKRTQWGDSPADVGVPPHSLGVTDVSIFWDFLVFRACWRNEPIWGTRLRTSASPPPARRDGYREFSGFLVCGYGDWRNEPIWGRKF